MKLVRLKGIPVVKPLDVFLRDHVRAPLKDKGFSKKGRDFRLVGPAGDVAVVNFFSRRLGYGDVEFILDAGIILLPHIDWLESVLGGEGGSGASVGSVESALWWTRLKSPYTYVPSPVVPYTDTWVFDLDDSDRVSFFLGELNSLVDRLRVLVDRQNLISMVRDPATEVQQLRSSREHALAFLLVDEGPSRELDEILRVLESKDPSDDVASWVRARLSRSRSG